MDAKKSCPHAIVSHGKLPVALEGVENSGQEIHQLHQRLIDEGCAAVVMESSGLYWMGVCDYLDLGGINAVLVNPRSLKAITGKKTDMSGSVQLAHLYRLGLLEPSYVPPQHIQGVQIPDQKTREAGRDDGLHQEPDKIPGGRRR